MSPVEFDTIITKDELKLRVTTNGVKKPRAGLLIIHGFGEHIDRYVHVYEFFSRTNILCMGMDLRGHGKSEGKKGHAKSFDLLLDDIEELMKGFRAEWNDTPMFLFGHSMGGNLVTNFVIKKPQNELAGFIASSPLLKLSFDPPKWQVSAARFLSKIMPSFSMDSKLDTGMLSKDQTVVKAYENDPYVNGYMSAGLYQMLMDAGQYALKNGEKISLPGLLYHGDEDKITSHDATYSLAQSNERITWISYNGVYHEGHNDLEKEEILKNLQDWIEKHI